MESTQPQTEEPTIKLPAALLPFNCEFPSADPENPHAHIVADWVLRAKRNAYSALPPGPGENLAERGIEWSKDVLNDIRRIVGDLAKSALEIFQELSSSPATQPVRTNDEK